MCPRFLPRPALETEDQTVNIQLALSISPPVLLDHLSAEPVGTNPPGRSSVVHMARCRGRNRARPQNVSPFVGHSNARESKNRTTKRLYRPTEFMARQPPK
jgi:hypothetical protein